MLIPICQAQKSVRAYSGEFDLTREMIATWAANFGAHEKVPVGMGHLPKKFDLGATDKTPFCWIAGLYPIGDYLFADMVDWTPEGKAAAVNNQFKNFSIETTGGDEDRITYVAALGVFDSAIDFKLPDGQRFQPFDFTKGMLTEEGRVILAAALTDASAIAMPYKTPPARIKDFFVDEKGPEIWTNAFNSAYEKSKDDAQASKVAWGAVENAGYAKGDDGKWRKSKTAAKAAKGVSMSWKKRFLAWLEEQLDEGDVAPEGVNDTPVPVVAAAAPAPQKDPEVVALATKVEGLEKALAAQEQNAKAAVAQGQAQVFAEKHSLPPAFLVGLADFFENKDVIRLDAEGKKTMPRTLFFERMFEDRGTRKFTDPIQLTEAPGRVSVTPSDGVIDPEPVRKAARELAQRQGKEYKDIVRSIFNLVRDGKTADEAIELVAKE